MTWALVTTRPGRTAQPEPSTPSPQAVPSTRTTAAAGAQHLGVGGDRRVGTGDRGGGAAHRRRRVDPVERVQDRAGGRQHLVEAAQDQRLLDVGAQAGGSRRVQGDGAEDPGEAERDRRDQGGAAGAVGQVQGRPADQPRPQAQREALDRDRDQRSGQQGPQSGAERRVRRLRALGEEQRAQAAAGKGSEGEADQGQGADDQALPVAPEPEGDGEGDDRPIEHGHL